MQLSDFRFVRLTVESPVSEFDCDDDDLNDFLHNEALEYQNQLLAVTYVFLDGNGKIVSFFSVSNDALLDKGYEKWNRLNRKVKNQKRRKNYPAVKIGRLGVAKEFAGKSIGTQIMDFVKGWFVVNNKTGCRFLMVDAYNNSKVLSFYSKNGFDFLTASDEKDSTRLMYFDLIIVLP